MSLYYAQFLLVTGLGVGVHRTLFKSCSLAFTPSHPACLPIASARLAAAVPIVVRSNNRLAAGVRFPSALRGVHDGGAIAPFFVDPPTSDRTLEGVLDPGTLLNISAFVLRLFAALFESRSESCSRAVGAAIWNVFGGSSSVASAGSSDCDNTRGVAFSVPHVISCLTAAGPSSEGVGEGIDGTREKLLVIGDLGRSMEVCCSST